MSRQYSEDEISYALDAGSVLEPLRVPVERAVEHPLLQHAVIVEEIPGRPYVTWPNFTERQHRIARDTVRLIHIDGRSLYLLPPRVNADWWLPPNPTRDDLRWRYGSHDDLPRWYLVIDPIAHPAQVTLVMAFTTDGERTFTQRSHRAGWMPLPAAAFVDMLDNPDLVMVATDNIAVDSWEQIWKVRTGG
jgi:hypothetical protein